MKKVYLISFSLIYSFVQKNNNFFQKKNYDLDNVKELETHYTLSYNHIACASADTISKNNSGYDIDNDTQYNNVAL